MRFSFDKSKIYYSILIITLSAFFLFFYIIWGEYKKIRKINSNLSFIEFIKYSSDQLLNSTFQNKRIKITERQNYINIFDKNFRDKGYILFSGYDDKVGTAVTKIYSLKNNQIIHKWIPPIDDIHKITPTYTSEYNLKKNYRMQHPLLTKKGELIFGSGEGPIAKINSCSKLIWAIDRQFHHSIEYYKNDLITVPIVINNTERFKYPILNHGYAIVDISSGKIVSEHSVIDILEKSKYIGLLYGVGEFEYDRIHLNDAEIIRNSDNFFLEGDVMLSSKHLSTVFVYRPSTKKIIWLKTGPWLNQHDVDYLGDGKFSIYGNDTFRYNKVQTYDVFYSSNNIYHYDYPKNEIKKIYINNMKNIKTPTQGLHKILKNEDLFIEETDNFKIHRFGKNEKRWDFVNLIDKNKLGSIHWSRYLDENTNLDWLNFSSCN